MNTIEGFTEVPPLRTVTDKVDMRDKVKAWIAKGKGGNPQLRIQIGSLLLKKIGVAANGMVAFHVSDSNPSIFLVRKWLGRDKGERYAGRKLSVLRNTQSLVQVTWLADIPESLKDGPRFLNHDMFGGGIRIFLPDVDKSELML